MGNLLSIALPSSSRMVSTSSFYTLHKMLDSLLDYKTPFEVLYLNRSDAVALQISIGTFSTIKSVFRVPT